MYLSDKFTWTEKLLLIEINSLDKGDGCYASNKYLASFLGISGGHVANLLSKLRKLGWIKYIDESNKRRISLNDGLKCVLDNKEDWLTELLIEKPSANEMIEHTESINGKDESIVEYEEEIPTDVDSTTNEPLPVKKKEAIDIIFQFWNLYGGNKKWKSHKKLSHDMIQALTEILSHYSVDDICAAIDNYAKVLLGTEYFWSHSWPLSIFFSVKHGPFKGSPGKWIQFLPDNFIEENYRSDRMFDRIKQRNVENENKQMVDDRNQELTEKLIKVFANLTNNPEFKPNNKQMLKFIEASDRMIKFYEKRNILRENWTKHLVQCLRKVYLDKGEIVYPGHLCSDNTWSLLMPQYMAELGE